MIRKYDYRVFPETRKSRVLLALAFLGGLALSALFVWAQIRAYSLEDDSSYLCLATSDPDCLQAQTQLAAEADETCLGTGNHFCLAPLGRVSPDLVRDLVDYYDDEYGLRVGVLEPVAIPEWMLNERRGQVDAIDLAELMEDEYPSDARSRYSILIGLTPVDIYISTVDWRYAFGLREPQPVISTARMDEAFYGLAADDDLTFSRATKLLSKYVGIFYYHLEPSDDPRSPMFNNILGPADLDHMDDRLPVQSY